MCNNGNRTPSSSSGSAPVLLMSAFGAEQIACVLIGRREVLCPTSRFRRFYQERQLAGTVTSEWLA